MTNKLSLVLISMRTNERGWSRKGIRERMVFTTSFHVLVNLIHNSPVFLHGHEW